MVCIPVCLAGSLPSRPYNLRVRRPLINIVSILEAQEGSLLGLGYSRYCHARIEILVFIQSAFIQ